MQSFARLMNSSVCGPRLGSKVYCVTPFKPQNFQAKKFWRSRLPKLTPKLKLTLSLYKKKI